MTPERWREIRSVYERAALLDTGDRVVFLEEHCATDLSLREEVESLLSYTERAGTDFLGTPAANLLEPTAVHVETAPQTGQRIGAYEVIARIGAGGMGEVFSATRADGTFSKKVAIKLVRAGFTSDFLLERFRNERQILAALDHPNIARLLDGGTTDGGAPFLVMEFVDGMPIDKFCDENRLDIAHRLHLFLEVCSAVQYAHQRLVIHRDLKPGNILVSKTGEAKLLDFGIAKILDPAIEVDATQARPMTLEYASPEQLRGQNITTASDIYSLGVILYRLLCGRSPYKASPHTPVEFSRTVTEVEPSRPSSVIGGALSEKDAAANPAADAQLLEIFAESSLGKLRRKLSGDLDSIILKALRKEPERRYATVEEFARDIQRHLDGLPVSAAKDSWRYSAEKFVRRNKTAVAAALLIALSLVVGIATTVRQARIANAERARAQKRFDDVRQFSNSLIFEVHDAIQAVPGTTAARKLLLDRAVSYLDRVSQDAAGDPDLQRELALAYRRLANVQGNSSESNLGEVSAAEISNQKASALFEAVAHARPTNTADLLNLAVAHRSIGASDIYYPSGLPEIEKAIAITQDLVKKEPQNSAVRSELADELQFRGFAQDFAGDRMSSAESLRQSLALQKEVLITNPADNRVRAKVAKGMVLLGYEVAREGNFSEARQQAEAGIEAYRSLASENPTPVFTRELATMRMRLGEIALLQNDASAARNNFDLAYDAVFPLAQLDLANIQVQIDVLTIEFERGRMLALTKSYPAAAEKLSKTIAAFEKLGGEEDSGPSKGAMWIWLGEAQFGMRKYSDALASFTRGVSELEKDVLYDDAICGIAEGHIRIGDTLLRLNRSDDAWKHYNLALARIDASAKLSDHDLPAIYSVAGAYAGMATASAQMADRFQQQDSRSNAQTASACDAMRKSSQAWQAISTPGSFSPSQFPAYPPQFAPGFVKNCLDSAAAH